MSFKSWYQAYSIHWGDHTKEDCRHYLDVIEAAYKAGLEQAAVIVEDLEVKRFNAVGHPMLRNPDTQMADAIRKEITND
jgi:hypothetical protein